MQVSTIKYIPGDDIVLTLQFCIDSTTTPKTYDDLSVYKNIIVHIAVPGRADVLKYSITDIAGYSKLVLKDNYTAQVTINSTQNKQMLGAAWLGVRFVKTDTENEQLVNSEFKFSAEIGVAFELVTSKTQLNLD